MGTEEQQTALLRVSVRLPEERVWKKDVPVDASAGDVVKMLYAERTRLLDAYEAAALSAFPQRILGTWHAWALYVPRARRFCDATIANRDAPMRTVVPKWTGAFADVRGQYDRGIDRVTLLEHASISDNMKPIVKRKDVMIWGTVA